MAITIGNDKGDDNNNNTKVLAKVLKNTDTVSEVISLLRGEKNNLTQSIIVQLTNFPS